MAYDVAVAGDHFAPLFNPPTNVGNAQGDGPARICPGGGGGTNIPGPTVADPIQGVLFITSMSGCSYEFLEPGIDSPMDQNKQTGVTVTDWARGAQADRPAPEDIDGLSIWKGPVGRITAIDMNTGEPLWMIPHGDAPQEQQDMILNHPLLQGVPNVQTNPGRPGQAVMVVTPTLLLAGGQTADGTWNLFAIDKQTGERVGAVPIPGVHPVRHVELGARRQAVHHHSASGRSSGVGAAVMH